ncbi:MAG: helix-turn-helix domain-containing protein [Bryobacteraceae bacterium]|jgi:excisionase family DNA binding protein
MKIEPAISVSSPPIPEPYINPQAAAEFLSISAKTLTRLARQGMIPAHAIGDRARRRWRFLKSELDTWMQARLHSNNHLRSHQEETH